MIQAEAHSDVRAMGSHIIHRSVTSPVVCVIIHPILMLNIVFATKDGYALDTRGDCHRSHRSWAHMAMGSGGMTFRVVTAEETSGHGGNSLGSGGHPPEAEERPRRRALQRRKRRFFKAVESQGNVIERGRPTRRGRGSRFMESLCFRLQDSVREVQSDVDRLRGEIQSSREEFQVAGREVYQRISTQAKLTGMQMLKIEGTIEESRRGRLSAEVGGGWPCDDDVQEQEEQEQIDFSDDASDNCASESDKLHEQESVASVDMASSASMDGAEIEGFDAPERSKLLLWCAREMKEMMRQVMDVQAETSYRWTDRDCGCSRLSVGLDRLNVAGRATLSR